MKNEPNPEHHSCVDVGYVMVQRGAQLNSTYGISERSTISMRQGTHFSEELTGISAGRAEPLSLLRHLPQARWINYLSSAPSIAFVLPGWSSHAKHQTLLSTLSGAKPVQLPGVLHRVNHFNKTILLCNILMW